MKWVCSNCGNHFESEDHQVRCPACLRRNGLIPEDIATRQSSMQKAFPWKPVVITGVIVMLVFTIGGIFWKVYHRPTPSTSFYGHGREAFTTLRQSVAQNTGLDLPHEENPFVVGPAVRDLARAWGGHIDPVMQKFQEVATAGLALTLGTEFQFPEALAAKVKSQGSTQASSLEWALLGHALGVALQAPVALGVAQFTPGKEAHPWGLGIYAVGLFPEGFEKTASWKPAVGRLQVDQWRILKSNEVLSAVLAQEALAKVVCISRPLEAVLPRDTPRSVTDADAQFASVRLQAAQYLADLPVIKAAAVWTYLCLGMNRKAHQASEQLVSTYEMLRQKTVGENFFHEQDFRRLSGMRALVRILEKDTAVTQDLQTADAEFAPLSVLAALGSPNGPDVLVELEKIPASNEPEMRFLRIVGSLGIQDETKRRERASTALQEARALAQLFPNARWPVQLLFSTLLETDNFEEARQLVPKMTRGMPNETQVAEGLQQIIVNAEEKRRSSAVSSSP